MPCPFCRAVATNAVTNVAGEAASELAGVAIKKIGNAIEAGAEAGAKKLDDVAGATPHTARVDAEAPTAQATDAGNGASAKIVPKADEGVIYRVSGDNTPSGKPYIGSSDDLEKRAKTATDGRDRTDAEVIGTYPKGDKDARRAAEQQAMNDNGGLSALDNKRNEIRKEDWEKYGVK